LDKNLLDLLLERLRRINLNMHLVRRPRLPSPLLNFVKLRPGIGWVAAYGQAVTNPLAGQVGWADTFNCEVDAAWIGGERLGLPQRFADCEGAIEYNRNAVRMQCCRSAKQFVICSATSIQVIVSFVDPTCVRLPTAHFATNHIGS